MLLFEDVINDKWCDIGAVAIDDYYYKNLSFDNQSPSANKYRLVLDELYSLLGNRGIKKLRGHEAIHLILLTENLLNSCTPSWENKLKLAFEDFRKESVIAKKEKTGDYWDKYIQWTMTSSDSKTSISKRHKFFTEKMFDYIKPNLKDSIRSYGNLEREIIYYRNEKKCAVCESEINWDELEIHHVIEHQHGGKTSLDNGISVHKICHPKGQDAIAFAERYSTNKN